MSDLPRDRRRWLLVLALIAGVLSMHALVVAGHGSASGHGQVLHASGHAMSPPPAEPRLVAAAMTAESMTAAPPGHGQPGSDHRAPASPPGTDHGLLHLCLAVLAAMATLVALALAWMTAPAAVLLRRRPGGPDSAPARPPPRSAVRLALLCVLRN